MELESFIVCGRSFLYDVGCNRECQVKSVSVRLLTVTLGAGRCGGVVHFRQ